MKSVEGRVNKSRGGQKGRTESRTREGVRREKACKGNMMKQKCEVVVFTKDAVDTFECD
jgi:hypothetical protein